jgi:hypothetical protein
VKLKRKINSTKGLKNNQNNKDQEKIIYSKLGWKDEIKTNKTSTKKRNKK